MAERETHRSFAGSAYAKQPVLDGDEVRPSVAAQGRAALDRILAGIDDHMGASEIGKQIVIELACLLLPDRTVLEAAKLAEMKPGGVARAQLDHYLNGKGATFNVDLRRLFDEDLGVAGWVGNELYQTIAADNDARGRSGKPAQAVLTGRRAMGQETYLNGDWRYAIGGCWWRWSIDRRGGMARVELIDRYRWYPHAHRTTQCVHQAAERLKDHGAADYDVRGNLEIPLSSLPALALLTPEGIPQSRIEQALAEFVNPEPPTRAPLAPMPELPEEPPGENPAPAPAAPVAVV